MWASTLSQRWLRQSEKRLESVTIDYLPQAYHETEAALLGKLQEGAGQAVLDLDGVAALDTAALRGLISLLRRARRAGGEIVLRSSRSDVHRTLSVTGLDRVFAVLPPKAA